MALKTVWPIHDPVEKEGKKRTIEQNKEKLKVEMVWKKKHFNLDPY